MHMLWEECLTNAMDAIHIEGSLKSPTWVIDALSYTNTTCFSILVDFSSFESAVWTVSLLRKLVAPTAFVLMRNVLSSALPSYSTELNGFLS